MTASVSLLLDARAEVARAAMAVGVDRSMLAEALGVSRATLYRHISPTSGENSEGQSRPQADPRSAAEWG